MKERINPADVSFASPLLGEAPNFDCDNTNINNWFLNTSRAEHSAFDCSVRQVRVVGVDGVAAFYALDLRLENKNDFTETAFDNLITFRDKITTVHIKWLAVRVGLERCGLGTLMMTKVFEDAYNVIIKVGAHALTVKYLGTASERLYRKSGMGDYGGAGSKKLFRSANSIIDFIES